MPITLLHVQYFYSCRKQLIKQVQYFVHLNLAIALLLGYILFIFGVNSKLIGGTSDVSSMTI